MEKPATKHLIPCGEYYISLCQGLGRAPDTIRGIQYAFRKFFPWCFERELKYIDEITVDVMDEYTQYLNQYRTARDSQPMGAANKYSLLLCIKKFIGKMHNRGLLQTDLLQNMDLPKVGRPLPKAIFTAEEVETILAQPLLAGLKGFRDRAVLELFFATGIRRIELLNLDIEDLDFEAQMLRVRRGKGNREYILPVSERACEWVMFYLMKLRPNLTKNKFDAALFLNDKGTRFRANALSDMASYYVRMAGFKRSGACHLFRHSTATIMLDNGADLRHVQEMLGHASITSTQVYTFVSRAKLTEVYEKTHPSALSTNRLFEGHFP